jgi:hypothetical protein
MIAYFDKQPNNRRLTQGQWMISPKVHLMKIGSRKTIIVPINQNKPISLESILNPKIEIGFILKTFSNKKAINATRR